MPILSALGFGAADIQAGAYFDSLLFMRVKSKGLISHTGSFAALVQALIGPAASARLLAILQIAGITSWVAWVFAWMASYFGRVEGDMVTRRCSRRA